MSPDRHDARRPGVLVAVVGPSGVGKDSLLRAAAAHPELAPQVRFVRRVVTRPASVESEDHDSLDELGFTRAEAASAFALCWAAHGLRYALPHSALRDVTDGATVVANLSRRSLDDAARIFGRLRVVSVTTRPEVLLRRLLARGRETEAAVRERLARQIPLAMPASAEGILTLDNSGDLAAAAEHLVRHLNDLSPVP